MVNTRTLRAAAALVVEPDAAFRSLIASSLRMEGLHVAEADGYATALEMIEFLTPEVIVIDASGEPYEFLARLETEERTSTIPVIAIDGNELRLAAAGVIERLTSPFGHAELRAAAKLALDADVVFERERIEALAGELIGA
jgi:CheY-like chemotaxis protein